MLQLLTCCSSSLSACVRRLRGVAVASALAFDQEEA